MLAETVGGEENALALSDEPPQANSNPRRALSYRFLLTKAENGLNLATQMLKLRFATSSISELHEPLDIAGQARGSGSACPARPAMAT